MNERLNGKGAAIVFDGATVHLAAEKGLARRWGTDNLELPIADVVSIDFRPASRWKPGRMVFHAVRTAGAYLPDGRSARRVVPDSALAIEWRADDEPGFAALHAELTALLNPHDGRQTITEKRAADKAVAKELEGRLLANNPSASFGGALVQSGQLRYNLGRYDLTDATAEATVGTPSKRSTFTRMGAGTLIAGPVGLVVGAAVRKDTTKCYVTIATPAGVIVVDGPAKDYAAAVKFADAVNRSTREDPVS